MLAYPDELIALAAELQGEGRLTSPDATGFARSRPCGSTLTVDVNFEGDRIIGFAQRSDACAIGRAVASLVAKQVVGLRRADIQDGHHYLRSLLQCGKPVPPGLWEPLNLFAMVQHHPSRHGSAQLVFTALEKAFSMRDNSLANSHPTNP